MACYSKGLSPAKIEKLSIIVLKRDSIRKQMR